jgi:hypothetical protein
MDPFEQYMKDLKGFVKNKAKPEGNMANGYLQEVAIGFSIEYLCKYIGVTKQAWDNKKEPTIIDEILEGKP